MRGLERLDRSLWTSVMEEMIGQQVVVICKANENLIEEEYEVRTVRQETARIFFKRGWLGRKLLSSVR